MWMVSSFAAWALGTSLAMAGQQATVHRCIGNHGEIAYSGQPCASMGNSVAPRPDNAGYRNFFQHCAVTKDDLIDRVAAAFDTGDVNLFGGLFLWRGMGSRNAYRQMSKLNELLQKPLIGIDLVSARGSAWRPPRPGSPQTLALLTAAAPGTAPTERRFSVVHRDGCLWLSF